MSGYDPDRLLDAYSRAVEAAKAGPALRFGLQVRDLLDEFDEAGAAWLAGCGVGGHGRRRSC